MVRTGVLLPKKAKGVKAPLPRAPEKGWRAVGWFGLLLAGIGLGDIALAWIPTSFGTPEWEFGTVAASMAGLPLVTMGLAALVGSGFAQGSRWMLRMSGAFLVLMALAVGAAFLLFLLDVPLALKSAPPEALLAIKKAIAKTGMLAVGFSGAYVVGGIAALTYAGTKVKEGVDA